MRRCAHAAVLGIAALTAARGARAGETTMSEPVIEENITDIDSRERQSLEFDLTPGAFRSTRTSAGFWHTGLEAEWRPFDRAGVGLELDALGSLDDARPAGAVHFVPRGSLSYVLLRDFESRVFLQAEIGARYDDGLSLALADPTEYAQPVWAGLREAMKLGPLDLRAGAFAETGGNAVHAPVRASGAALYTIVGATTRGAIGAELLADWSRAAPFVLAPEVQFLTRIGGKPVRFEVAVPFTLGAKENSAYGLAFRFVLEPNE
jgi:hypothetical protein